MKKTKIWLLSALTAAAALSCSQRPDQTASYDVIPLPRQVELAPEGGDFRLTGSTVIACPASDEALRTDAVHLQGYIEQLTGHRLKITDKAPESDAILLRADLGSDNPEGYVLTVTPSLIEINGTTPAGTFYGIQTLRKSIPSAEKCNVLFPAATITDEPRFAYRGAHFDVSRHFFPADSVKTFIDMMALHNLNTFHWHLTDDQGWRVEIKSRPRLAEISSKRPSTVIGHNTERYDSIPVEGYYTQDEIRDIIKYAADRHITIIPEIDLPGHMVSALAAYPEMGCTGGPYEVWNHWGVSEDVLCAGSDSTYKFIDDVLGELADLFPSEYIHVGGDECPKVRWAECPKCRAKAIELGLVGDERGTKEEKLQSHIIHHASDFLASKGKKMIGWDETLEGGLAPGAVVMSWRGEQGGIEAAKQGHDVIMTPNTYLYFDYYQTMDQANEPDAIGGYVPLEKVYGYEPITDVFTPEEAAHIIGVQANLWTEYIPTFSQAQYMELPRMAALSEVQWTVAPKDYKAFLHRLPQLLGQYEANSYRYSNRAFDLSADISTDPVAGAVVFELSAPDDAPIRYTLDGTEPTADSPLYEQPVRVEDNAVLKAVAVRPVGTSRVYTDTVSFSKSTAKAVTLVNQPAKNYTAHGPATLVDGIRGKAGYSSGGWLGFAGNDAVAVIDLGEPAEISEVATRTCVATGAWVFDARTMKAEVSDDGTAWRTVASETYPALEEAANGIFAHALAFEPVTARYVRVTVEPEKDIPAWHMARGKRAFVFIDEIEIN